MAAKFPPNRYILLDKAGAVTGYMEQQDNNSWTSYDNSGAVVANSPTPEGAAKTRYQQTGDI